MPALTDGHQQMRWQRMTDMQMANLRDITRDYADTLNAWHEVSLEA